MELIKYDKIDKILYTLRLTPPLNPWAFFGCRCLMSHKTPFCLHFDKQIHHLNPIRNKIKFSTVPSLLNQMYPK